MPPPVALFLCIVFIIALFHWEKKQKEPTSPALWLPILWFLILGSRYVSQWLYLGVTLESPDEILEGSPMDRNVFLAFIIVSFTVLLRRNISWLKLMSDNKWIFILLFYFGVTIIWSDYPMVSFKRWTKTVGNLIVALVVLTDTNPRAAFKVLMQRCSFILLPLSVVVIKYYPYIGRTYGRYTGETIYTGVTNGKNALGALCLVFGLFYFWRILSSRLTTNKKKDTTEIIVHLTFLAIIGWLMHKANSQTALSCLLLGASVLLFLGVGSIKRNIKSIGAVFFVLFSVAAFLLLMTDIKEYLIVLMGRELTLTGRTDLWEQLLESVSRPLIGTGYGSYWLGDRLAYMWDLYFWRPNQAHNGYIETYINTGWIGVILFVLVLVSTYFKSIRTLTVDYEFGRLFLSFSLLFPLYNYTEAVQGFSSLFFIFILFALSDSSARNSVVQGEPVISSVSGANSLDTNVDPS